LPEVECGRRADAKSDAVNHAVAGTAASRTWVLKESEVRSGGGSFVAVEEVVDRGVVLVDGLLEKTKSQDAGVEGQVLGSVGGDGGDVVDAVKGLHEESN
jgi:hypothetical protein